MTMKFPKEEGRASAQFTRNLVKRYKVVPYLDDYLKREPEGFRFLYEPKLKDDGWHPSGHCLPTPSQLYYYATVGHLEDKQSDDPTRQKTFAVGHFWHQLLQHAAIQQRIAEPDGIERRGIRGWGHTSVGTVREVDSCGRIPWAPWHYTTGSGDIAPCVTDNWRGVVDFKTMSSAQYRTPGLPDWIAGKYEAQINIYMDYFDEPSGIIVAILKDTPHEMKEWEFARNQPLIDAIYAKWEYVSSCVRDGVGPDPEEDDFWNLEEFLEGPVEQS